MSVESVQKAIDLLEQGRAEQAIPMLEDTVVAYPAYAGAYVLLARAYETGERWALAARAWREVLLLVPDSPVAAEGLRRSMRQGRHPILGAPADYDGIEALHQEAAPARIDAAANVPQTSSQLASKDAGTRNSGTRDIRTRDVGDDLDRLIQELEGARITPRPDLDAIPEPDLDDDLDDMVSETLARIYEAQKQYAEAAKVFHALADQHPERREEFEEKAAEMSRKAEGEAPAGPRE